MEEHSADSATPTPAISGEHAWVQPSSSRMLATYLADLEQLLDDQLWAAALRDACALPRIAVALADPQMRSSTEQCKAWCEEWVRSPDSDEDSEERIAQRLSAHFDDDDEQTPPGIPANALQRLRLCRHARTHTRGFSPERAPVQDRDGADALEICTAVVDGVRRWYAHSACHDAIAQGNLARLAVLR